MSESRMNSWRLSSRFWPTDVRNLMPSNDSSSVRCTSPLLRSRLHISEAGAAAPDTISQLLGAPAGPSAFKRDEVRLLAPEPLTPQMRDFLCFEQHLRQAFEAVAKLRGTPPRIPEMW